MEEKTMQWIRKLQVLAEGIDKKSRTAMIEEREKTGRLRI